jgi:UDP:flavonoid glycosyltransferase YjiC (YdhE family)
LRHRGNAIAFVTGHRIAATLTDQKIPRLPFGNQDLPSFSISQWGTKDGYHRELLHVGFGIANFTPDVLVANMFSLGAILAAEIADVPIALFGVGAYLFPTRPVEKSKHKAYEALRYRRWVEMHRVYDSARELVGLAPRGLPTTFEDSPLLGNLFLLPTIPELEGDLTECPPSVHAVGNCLWSPRGNHSADQPVCGKSTTTTPLIFVQQGRTFGEGGFWEVLMSALEASPIKAVADIGRMDAIRHASSSNIVVSEFADLTLALSSCCGVVCGGNTTAVMGALTHGLPLIIFPLGNEGHDMGLRCQEAGVAIILDSGSTDVGAMKLALDRLVKDAGLHTAAQVMKAAFERFGNGACISANFLEGLR